MSPAPWKAWVVLCSMCVGSFTLAFTGTSVMNAMLKMQLQLHLNPVILQWLLTAYFLTSAVFLIIMGKVSGFVGQRNSFMFGIIVFAIGSAIVACSYDATWVIVGRAIQGFGTAFLAVCTLSIAKLQFSEAKQAMASSIWGTAQGVGFTLGPIVSGLIVSGLSWRYIFWLLIVLMILSLTLLFIARTQNIRTTNKLSIDAWGATLLIVGLLTLILGLADGNSWGWSNPWTIVLLAIGGVCLIALCIIEPRRKDPLVHLEFFRFPRFTLGCVGILLTLFNVVGILYFINVYLQNHLLLNYSPLQAGLALLPFGVVFFLVSLLAPILPKYIKLKYLVIVSALFSAGGFLWLCFISVATTYYFIWPGLVLIAIGLGFAMGLYPSSGMTAVPDKYSSAAAAFVNTFLYLGCILGPAIGTIFLISIGTGNLFNSLQKLSTHLPNHKVITEAIAGHHAAVLKVLGDVSVSQHATVLHAIQHATIVGMISVMIVCSAVALLQIPLVLFCEK